MKERGTQHKEMGKEEQEIKSNLHTKEKEHVFGTSLSSVLQ